MKRIAGLILMALMVPISGFARSTDSANVHFDAATRVVSSDLPAGDYKVTWTGSGADAQVSFTQGRKVVATVPAKVVPANNEATTLETDNPGGNETVLQVIHLAHFTLSFGAPTTAQR
jgi:hypothetical protein